ncbi:MAG: 2-amino-4-hydroxy-6-hydroxymethyldihydropteridine diphosphokinase [Candidatus Nanopelagicales bacterium]
MTRPKERAVLGLGANLGDARAALRSAIGALAAERDVFLIAVSGLWRTAAVGGPEQPDYLNAVVVVDTTREPAGLLELAHQVEAAAGRVRDVRWGPRTLDVDVIAVEGVTSLAPDLTLPHPRAHERAFVLAPWAQLQPGADLEVPGVRTATVGDWAAQVTDQSVTLLDGGPWWR